MSLGNQTLSKARFGGRSAAITDSTLALSRPYLLREAAKNSVFFLGDLSQICLPTHPRVFVRFGKTKGEIWVEKSDFRSNLGGVLRGLDLV